MRHRNTIAVSLSALFVTAILATSAQATIVTLGSPLSEISEEPNACPVQCTLMQSSLPEPGAVLVSPVDGTIINWRMTGGSPANKYALRVLTPGAATAATGAGTSAARSPTDSGLQTFATSLPIHVGQRIGIDLEAKAPLGVLEGIEHGVAHVFWALGLADGATAAGTELTGLEGFELGFNAEVDTSIAPGPPVSPQPPELEIHCVVPKLSGRSLKADRKRLSKADCKLGRVKGKRGKAAKVKAQSVKPGTVLPAGSKVAVKVG